MKNGNAKKNILGKSFQKKTGKIYKRRKIDVEPVFGFLKANLSFLRFSVRGRLRVENELGLALMAVNLRKYAAKVNHIDRNKISNKNKNGLNQIFIVTQSIFLCVPSMG